MNAPAEASLHSHSPSQPVFRRAWLFVVLLFLLVYAGSAVSPGLPDEADSTHADAAREMYSSGDYVTLDVNGIR